MRPYERRAPLQLVLVVGCLAAGACGTTRAYEGPELPRDQIAVIQPANGFDHGARVIRVDATALGLFDKAAEVAPGKHVVTLSITIPTGSGTSTAQGDVELDAKAGATYEAHGSTTGFIPMQHWYWIVDRSTQAIVAGKRPGE